MTVEQAMAEFDISRPMLFKLYNTEGQIADKYFIKAKKLGLTELELTEGVQKETKSTVANNEIAGLSAAQWMKRWEDEVRARKEDRSLFERMYNTMEKDLEVFRSLVKVRQ